MAKPDDAAQVASDDVEHPIRDVVRQLEAHAHQPHVSLRELVEASGTTSFVPAMMVPALLVVSPLSGIPFFSSLCGLTIAIIALQMLFRRSHLQLPAVLARRQVPGTRLQVGLQKMERVADFLDRHTHRGRLPHLVGHGGRGVSQLLCVVAGASMPMLELMPLSSSILGAAVLSFSVGMLTRDGVFVLIGMMIMGTAAAVPVFIIRAVF